MQRSLTLLFVDDSGEDIELAVRALQSAGIDPVWKVAQSEPALRRVLAGWAPELIISDFSMPTLTGVEALQVCRELAPGVPFIFFTGMLGAPDLELISGCGVPHVSKDSLELLPAEVMRSVSRS